ncbi:dCTP deaminase domain-containing protein [Brassicibacter mesophilus]|uniref:dCTP deaminase domain-containing protein n=1 Tax=Brassicibacter mesophilus TaxID=745119 RepID=UPI003D1CB786
METSIELTGFLSDTNIKDYIKNKKIAICPYEEENLTPLGYNLTPTEFIFSTNNKLLVNINNDNDEKYCYIEPHDTVLILTREAIWVSNEIAGTFHSKVGVVSQGFGHISTTLDPNWQGPLLISLNNPTNQKLKFVIAKISDPQNKSDELSFKYCSFVTLIFYKLVSPTTSDHDNPSCRFDLLNRVVIEPKQSLWSKILFGKKYRKHYNELRKFISNIGSIDFIKLGIKGENDIINAEDFEKKYEKFTETIKFYTDAAHSANKEIISIKYFKTKLKKIILFIIYILPLGSYLYLGWKLGIRNEKPSTDGYMFLVYIAAIVPLVIETIKPMFNIITKYFINERGI